MHDYIYRCRFTRSNGARYVSDEYASKARAEIAKYWLEEDEDREFVIQSRHKDSNEWRDLA